MNREYSWAELPEQSLFTVVTPTAECNKHTGKVWSNRGVFVKIDAHRANRLGDQTARDCVFPVCARFRKVSTADSRFRAALAKELSHFTRV